MDVRVTPRDDLNVDDFKALLEVTRGDYPEVNDQFSIEAAINLGERPTQSITPRKEGVQFSRPTKDKLFQAQRSGWAFNKLAPYDRWEVFSEEGRALWEAYREIARPTSIRRLALRYINRLTMPMPVRDFKDWILTYPEIAPNVPQGLTSFLMQLHIPHPDIDALMVVNVAMAEPPSEVASVVLDIDVFRTANVPQSDDDMWSYFELLRHKKNESFEASITNAMRERFQ
jgi:uncharacterized protein (TIGR04255 family)